MRMARIPLTEYLKIVIPAIMAVVLFSVVVFGVFLPIYRESLLADKKEMIRELTGTVWTIVRDFEQKERAGLMSRGEAQLAAIEVIRAIRYGEENKDYFWINDMRPFMVMHPYRSDLEGKDIAGFSDPHGIRLFVEFVKTVQEAQEGYVSYMWQWKDDPDRIVPKLSFVKQFAPWGWVIGTGIYLEDVRREFSLLSRRLIVLSLGILALVASLSTLSILRTLKETRLRRTAEQELLDYQDQLEDLIEERTADLGRTNDRLKDEIAERQRREKLIRKQWLLLRGVMESLPYPFYVVNTLNRRIILANSATVRSGDSQDKTCDAVMHGRGTPCPDEEICPIDTVVETGRPLIQELVYTDAEGKKSYVERHAYPIEDRDGGITSMIEYLIDITDRKLAEVERERLVVKLRKALDDIHKLQGIVPICAYCNKIRDDSGYWNQLEKYISEHSSAEFSHSICPKCMADRYPGADDQG